MKRRLRFTARLLLALSLLSSWGQANQGRVPLPADFSTGSAGNPAAGGVVGSPSLPGTVAGEVSNPSGLTSELPELSSPDPGGQVQPQAAQVQEQLGEVSAQVLRAAELDGERGKSASDQAFDQAPPTGPPGLAVLAVPSGSGATAQDPADVALSDLKREGFAILPVSALVPQGLTQRLLAEVETSKRHVFGSADLYDAPKGWLHDAGALPSGGGGVRQLLEQLTSRLKSVLSDEPDLVLRDAELRIESEDTSPGGKIHMDLGGYLTATLAFQGPGTFLFPLRPHLRILQAPTGAVAIITNLEREAVTGIAGTVHTAARNKEGKRVVLIARFERQDPETGRRIPEDRTGLAERAAGRIARVQKSVSWDASLRPILRLQASPSPAKKPRGW